MIKKILFYIFILILILIIFLIYCQVLSLKKRNNDIQILQSETPNENTIQNLIVEKYPTVFRQVLFGWEPIIETFDTSINHINHLIKTNNEFTEDLIKCLNSYSMCFSLGWDYDFNEYKKHQKDNYFTLEQEHRHIICQITGEQKILLASPSQSKYIKSQKLNKNIKNNIISTTNFWNKKETCKKPFCNLEYIEIILREGNILYIPEGWWFLSIIEEDSIVLNAYNLSFISLFC